MDPTSINQCLNPEAWSAETGEQRTPMGTHPSEDKAMAMTGGLGGKGHR